MKKIVVEERINSYDLLYFTQNNSQEDRANFDIIAQSAVFAQYIYIPPRRFDVLNHICLWWESRIFAKNRGYGTILVASINNIVFNAILEKHRDADLVTVDDGVGNMLSDGMYSNEYGGRAELYRRLLGASSLKTTRGRISRHYTIFKDATNIVSKHKLRFVDLGLRFRNKNEGGPVFFIGQPFKEILNDRQIERLRMYLQTIEINYYVRHPRECVPLDFGAAELVKDGLIAEEAIARVSNGARPTLIGVSSAVLFTLSSAQADKIMLIFAESKREPWIQLGVSAGCKLVCVP